LSRRALGVIQQSTEPRTPTNPARASTTRALLDEPILESLMIPFAMVVINKFFQSSPEMALTDGLKGAQIPSRRKVVLVNHAAKSIATLDSSTAPIGMS
jgi:hypothetical protein